MPKSVYSQPPISSIQSATNLCTASHHSNTVPKSVYSHPPVSSIQSATNLCTVSHQSVYSALVYSQPPISSIQSATNLCTVSHHSNIVTRSVYSAVVYGQPPICVQSATNLCTVSYLPRSSSRGGWVLQPLKDFRNYPCAPGIKPCHHRSHKQHSLPQCNTHLLMLVQQSRGLDVPRGLCTLLMCSAWWCVGREWHLMLVRCGHACVAALL